MRIYIIRHGDPDYETDTLTPAGQLEARALAAHMAEIGVDELYSSPQGRAMETAQFTADTLRLPVTIEPWSRDVESAWVHELNRLFKDLDGSLPQTSEIIRALSPWQEVPPLDHPLIERNVNLINRGSDDFLSRQGFVRKNGIYEVEKENRKKIAIFTHQGVGLTWLSHLLAIPLPLMWAGFFLPPTSVTTVLMDERIPGFAFPRCLGMADVSHLVKAGLESKPLGIFANFF